MPNRHAQPRVTTAFLERAIAYSGTDCLLWPFGKSAGYGRLGKGYAHRVVCEAAHGPPPAGYQASHSCGVRACINPQHLRWDTAKGNEADKIVHYGGQHPNAALTVAQARQILRSEQSARILAAEYGVTHGTIQHIRHKRNWGWL